jgi:hypothetical protein
MDLPDTSDDLDLVLRHVTRLFPEQLARALVAPGSELVVKGWADTQVTSRQRRLDRALDVLVDGDPRLLHNEWAGEMTADLPFRIYEYHVLTALSLADELASAPKPPEAPAVRVAPKMPTIESTLVLLSGREQPWPREGEFRTSPADAPFSGVKFRIEPVYQYTVEELEARGSLLWLIFAPLAVDASPKKMGRVVESIRGQSSPREFEELAVAMTAVADHDKRKRGLREQIVAFLPREVVVESWVYQQGVTKSKAEAVLDVLEARRIEVSQADRERIERCTDTTILRRWVCRAATVDTTAALFDEPAS